ncbi:MAG TPA: glycosyltransferase [Rhodospirillales bacterium]|jgi:hopene-associated glycosyltransferase HpnB|nr:glycosyltransferase [Rhodospirillales bacterium]HJO85865.1 glycosyltransferase [Rhodospirillales bacterium]|tara:strand:- start:408 stop:1556 length:1149 start_codon:yes stop_codon:yes gene_type:complete
MILIILAGLSLAIWIVLVFFRGQFWRADQCLAAVSTPLTTLPNVIAIVPSRNEEMTIGRTIASLLAQDYPGEFSIVIVDDNSDDDTANAVKVAAQATDHVTIVEGSELPTGWTGKMWAVAQGVETAEAEFPNSAYYLLTDADIAHHPGNLSELMAKAVDEKLALVSLMVRLRCETRWEHLLIPAFVFFFQKLYPFPWVNDSNKATAGAAGGCLLVKRSALENAGGIEAIKNDIIDDCALAKLLKKSNPIWLGLTHSTISLRGYDKLSDVWQMVCRTAFVQLNHSTLKLAGTLFGMLLIYIVPIATILIGFLIQKIELLALGLGAWALMAIAYTPTLRLYSRPAWEACLLPLAALLYTAMTLDSARQYWSNNAPAWKGRPNVK